MLVYFVEDDKSISYILDKTLEKIGVNKKGFSTGAEFVREYEKEKPDLILLDLMLPDTSGIELLKFVRNNNKDIPIIIISALFNEIDKVLALDSGADDYITKPFGILELTSRIQAKLRKVDTKSIIEYEDIKFDLKQYKVFIKDEELVLTTKEYEILKYLISNNEKVLTKEEIFFNVWDSDFMGESRALDMHIKALREKLKKANSIVKIKTVYAVGYKIGHK
ncbi:MAG: response regulator transcription factor [Acholeplasmataceae bacterium]|nr:response regulator transcription factor [Acholeplasmataceae bacterium]